MKRIHGHTRARRTFGAIALAALVVGVAFAASAAARGPGGGMGLRDPAQGLALVAPAASLSADEQAALRYMREEELVAHDLYAAFATRYASVPAFARIAASETQHASAVAVLLDRYGIADPAASHVAGTFSDPALQALYDKLLARGTASLGAAADVGLAVETQDIADLQARLQIVRAADVQTVFESLLAGSQNHLRAFTMLAARF